MSALGILGGIGKGLTAGREESRRRKNDEQARKIRDYQIAQMDEDAQLREETRRLMSSADADAAAMQAQSRANSARIGNAVTQGNADAAMAADTGNAIKAGISDTVSRLTAAAPATPTPGQLTAAPTGIAAGANRVADLSNTNPRTSQAANAQPMSKEQAQAVSWKQKSEQLAAIYRKHGKIKEADDILKSGESAEMNVYSHQFDSAMRDLALGATQSAAGKLAALHNMSSADGSFVDIQPNKDGTFTATQFNADGKSVGSKVVGPKELDDFAERYLSPAQVALRKQQLIADTQLKKAQLDADVKDRRTGAQIVINADRNSTSERNNERTTSTSRENNIRTTSTSSDNNKRTNATSSDNNKRTTSTSSENNQRTTGTSSSNVDKQESGKDKRNKDRIESKGKPAFGSKPATTSKGKIVKDADGNLVYQR